MRKKLTIGLVFLASAALADEPTASPSPAPTPVPSATPYANCVNGVNPDDVTAPCVLLLSPFQQLSQRVQTLEQRQQTLEQGQREVVAYIREQIAKGQKKQEEAKKK